MSDRLRNNVIAGFIVVAFWIVSFSAMAADPIVTNSTSNSTVTTSTDKVDTRARGRAIALTISNTAVDTSWKLGTFRLDIQTGGRR